MCKILFKLTLCRLIVFHRLRSKTVNNGSISACKLLVQLITVNNISKCTAYFRELSRSEITCKTEFIYRIQRYKSIVSLQASVL